MPQAFKNESKKMTDSGQHRIQKQTKVEPLLVDFWFLKPTNPIFCKVKKINNENLQKNIHPQVVLKCNCIQI